MALFDFLNRLGGKKKASAHAEKRDEGALEDAENLGSVTDSSKLSDEPAAQIEPMSSGPSAPSIEEPSAPSAEEPSESIGRIGLERLRELDNFIDDIKMRREDAPKWEEGQFLKKSFSVLSGTQRVTRPKYSVRLNFFVANMGRMSSGAKDPWLLVATNRSMYLALADVYYHGDVTQYTFVEVPAEDVGRYSKMLLDDEAREQVRSALIGSYAKESPGYATDQAYLAATGNEHGVMATSSIRFVQEIDPSELKTLRTEPYGLRSIRSDDSRFETYFEIPDPAFPDDLTKCYRQAREKWQNEHTDGNFTFTDNNPDEYRDCIVFHVDGDTARVFGYASWGQVRELDVLVPESGTWMILDNRPYVKVTNKGKYASGNVNVLKENTKYERVASWVKDTDSTYLVTYTKPEFAQAETRFDDFRVMTLYLAVTIGAPRLREIDELEHRLESEALLDTVPEHYEFAVPDGRIHVNAMSRYEDGHPALAYIEAQKNAESVVRSQIDRKALEKLYDGDRLEYATVLAEKMQKQIWFSPFANGVSYPLLSTEYDALCKAYTENYEEQRDKDPDGVISREQFAQVLANDRRLFEGDIATCWNSTYEEAFNLETAYRYEFSCSFDPIERTAKVNLFLPQRALFPTFEMQRDPNWGTMKKIVLTEKKFNDKWANTMCDLGVYTLCLVKRYSPWVQTVCLSAWYRSGEDPLCLYSVRADEHAIANANLGDSLSSSALQRLGARITRGGDWGLVPVESFFDVRDALDYRFGFRSYVRGWTLPARFPRLTYDERPASVAAAIDFARVALTGDSERAYRIVMKQIGACERKWLLTAPKGATALSCNSALEEDLTRSLKPGERLHFLPRGLSELYLIAGVASVERNDLDDARDYLERALSLNPANASAMVEMAHVENALEDADAALEWIMRLQRVAYLPELVAAAYRQMAYHATERGDMEDAGWLLWHSFYVGPTKESVEKTYLELTYLDEQGVNAFDFIDRDKPQEETAEQVRLELATRGYPTGVNETVVALAKQGIDACIEAGEIPDASYVQALDCVEYARGGRPGAELRRIQKMISGVLFSQAQLTDYLYQPILLSEPDFVLEGVAPECPIPPDGDAVYPAVIPFIAEDGTLLFDFLAFVRFDDGKVHVVGDVTDGVALAADSFAESEFRAVVPGGLAGVDLEERAMRLLDAHRPSAHRDSTRSLRIVDHLRSFERPDDVVVVLEREGLQPEAVWMTMEYAEKGDDGYGIYARLAVEPCDDFGLHVGDISALAFRVNQDYPDTLQAFVEC